MKRIVFLNGKFISREEAKTSPLAPGFLYGWGLFESMRCYKKKIVYFSAHLERIKKSCALIAIKFPYSLDRFREIIRETIRINGFSDSYVRLTLWKADAGANVMVTAEKYQPYSPKKYRIGFNVCVSRFRQSEDSFLAELKTNNYLLCRLSYLEAEKKAFNEAIILNNRGYIAEASRANIFLVKDKELLTPDLKCGCLNGITRRVVLDLTKKYGIRAYEGNFTLSDLYAANEAFLTNSLIGVMPLASVESQKIGKGPNQYKLTSFFRSKYKSLLLGNAI